MVEMYVTAAIVLVVGVGAALLMFGKRRDRKP